MAQTLVTWTPYCSNHPINHSEFQYLARCPHCNAPNPVHRRRVRGHNIETAIVVDDTSPKPRTKKPPPNPPSSEAIGRTSTQPSESSRFDGYDPQEIRRAQKASLKEINDRTREVPINKLNTPGVTNTLGCQILVAEIERTSSGRPPYNCTVRGLNLLRSCLVRKLIYIANFAMLLPYEHFDDISTFIRLYILVDMQRPDIKKIIKAYGDKFYLGLSPITGCMAIPPRAGRNMNTHEFVQKFFRIKTAGQHKIYLTYDTKEDDPELSSAFSTPQRLPSRKYKSTTVKEETRTRSASFVKKEEDMSSIKEEEKDGLEELDLTQELSYETDTSVKKELKIEKKEEPQIKEEPMATKYTAHVESEPEEDEATAVRRVHKRNASVLSNLSISSLLEEAEPQQESRQNGLTMNLRTRGRTEGQGKKEGRKKR
jgi:hypothetical protein